MTELVLAALVLVLTHALPALKPVRAVLVAGLGERVYMVLYSLLSLAVIVWLGFAYGRAPYVEVWPYAPWTRWVPVLVMPLACILFVAALGSPNPLSMGGGGRGFDPARPGVVAITRHPLIWALVLWAGAHIPPNGDVASLILFGLLLVLSLAGPPSLDAKRRATLGPEAWRALAGPTSNLPLAAVLAGRARLDAAGIGVSRVAGGLLLFGVLMALHEWAIGVSPLPG